MRKIFAARYAKLLDREGPIMLNIGCGTDYKDGWINVDNNSDHNIEKLDLNWDMRKPLPFPDKSVDYIFNEHFFEHLTVEEMKPVVRDLMRVLKPGGVLRIAMPDLEYSIKMYQDKDWRKNPFLKKFGLEFVETRAEMLNMHFRWWGHKWLYDWEELERRLQEAGCKKSQIERAKISKSKHKELRDLEIRGESYLIAEITK